MACLSRCKRAPTIQATSNMTPQPTKVFSPRDTCHIITHRSYFSKQKSTLILLPCSSVPLVPLAASKASSLLSN